MVCNTIIILSFVLGVLMWLSGLGLGFATLIGYPLLTLNIIDKMIAYGVMMMVCSLLLFPFIEINNTKDKV
jgi:hypothetical protein